MWSARANAASTAALSPTSMDEADIVRTILPDRAARPVRAASAVRDTAGKGSYSTSISSAASAPARGSRRRRRRRNRRPSAPGPAPAPGSAAGRRASRRAAASRPATGRSAQPEACQSAPVNTSEHAGRLFRRGDIDRADAGMRVRRAQHIAVGHARQHEVVDIAAAAAQQPRILEARDRLTQREFPHRFSPSVFSVLTGRQPVQPGRVPGAHEPTDFGVGVPATAVVTHLIRSRAVDSGGSRFRGDAAEGGQPTILRCFSSLTRRSARLSGEASSVRSTTSAFSGAS